jgi:hypothetical protein
MKRASFSVAGAVLAAQLCVCAPAVDSTWLTTYERSGCLKTGRYDETVAYCKRLAGASPLAKFISFGVSARGRDLPLVILSQDRMFEPAQVRQKGKAVILIQSGIHAGEIDGKDASQKLMREIVITGSLRSLLDHAVLLFIPIFNVDGHERFGPYNRINQNGPVETGWRVTAQNLNLNRDYMKADTPEMRAFLTLFNRWLPDLYIDCHVTDGIDFQYDVTYTMELGPNIDPGVSAWMSGAFLPRTLHAVEASGHKVFTYVFPREDHDVAKGLTGGAAPPRFSTGYAALQNRPALLIETHMLKAYRTRVEATYHFLRGAIASVSADVGALTRVLAAADSGVVRRGRHADGESTFPLTFGLGPGSRMTEFLAIRSVKVKSELSGGERTVYTGEPGRVTIPFFDRTTIVDSVAVPFAYILPPEWEFAPQILKMHGLSVRRLTRPITLEVESYRFNDVRWQTRPFEGRHGASYTSVPVTESRTYPRGSVIVSLDQRGANVAVHLFEPESKDSFIAWGFFDAIFEQKEYAESYIMEKVGREMLERDSSLQAEFRQKVETDTVFAARPEARLNWLYLRSPWGDPWLSTYPVGRIVTSSAFLAAVDAAR